MTGLAMDVTITNEEGKVPVTVVRIDGHVDASNASDLESRAMRAIGSGVKNMLIDMEKVTFMSSAGFRSIHKIYQALDPEGGSGHMKILNPSDEISRLIRTLGFDNFVAVVSGGRREAVDSF